MKKISKKALHKDFIMEIKKSKARFISIFFIVALGVAFFSGIQSASPDMRFSGDAYYDASKLMDLKVVGTLGITDENIQALNEVKGVAHAEGAYSTDIISGQGSEQKVLHLESINDRLNQVTVTQGRLPEKEGECLLDSMFVSSTDYELGDKISVNPEGDSDLLKVKSYEIVGIGTSPLYISFNRGNTTLGSGEINGFAYVTQDNFDSEVYTQAYLLVKEAELLTSYTDSYTDLVSQVQDRVEGIADVQCDARYEQVLKEANEKLADARKELEDGKKEADEKLADARKELEDAQKELADGKKEYEDGKQELEDAKAQLADARQQITDGRAQLESGRQQLAEARAQLVDGQNQMTSARAELDSGWAQINNAKAQLASGQAQLDQAKEELAPARAQLEDGKAQLEQGRQELEQGKQTLSQKEQELAAAEIQIQEGEAQLEAGRQELAANQAAYEEGMAQLEAGEAQAAQAREQLTQQQAVYDQGAAQLEAQRAQYEQAAASGAFSEEELAAMEQQINAAQAQLDAAAGELAQGWAQLQETEGVLGAAREQLNAAKAQLDAGMVQLDSKAQELAAAKTQTEEGKAQIAQGWKEIQENEKLLADSQAEITANEEKLAAGEAEIAANEQQLLAASQEIAANEQTLLDGEAQLWQSQQTMQAGEAEIAANEQQLAEAEREIQENQQKLDDGEKEIQENEEKLLDAQKEIEDGQKELDKGWKEYEDGEKDAREEIADGEKKIQDAQKEIDDLEKPKWYVTDRNDLPEYSDYGDNADRIRNIGRVFPVMFFLVAALISLTTMTRMVEEHRTQIGTLKALGYGKYDIASKYLNYAFLATVGGSILGVLIGEKILPYIIIHAYGIMYHNMSTHMQIDYELKFAMIASVGAVLCTMGATVSACYKELAETPASLMRPPAPKEGKRVLLERIPLVWKHLSFTWKSTVRNLFRYKKRFFMTIFGISGSMALMLVGFGLQDSIMDIAVRQYERIQHYEAMIIDDEDATQEEKQELQKYLEENEKIDHYNQVMMTKMTTPDGRSNLSVYVYVPQNLEAFKKDVTLQDRTTKEQYQLTDEGAVICEKTADLLDLKRGDNLILEEDKVRYEVKITDICENYMGHYVYLTPKVYEETFGKAPKYNDTVFMMKPEYKEELEDVGQEILDYPAALSISYMSSLKGQLDRMLSTLGTVIIVLIISAGMLAFVVLYNLNNINITERQRELATLKVLGFFDGEVSQYVFRENILLTVLGVVFGAFLGILLHRFVIVTVEVDAVMFGRNIASLSFVYSGLITCAFSAFVNMTMHFKLKKIDMVESLKSVE